MDIAVVIASLLIAVASCTWAVIRNKDAQIAEKKADAKIQENIMLRDRVEKLYKQLEKENKKSPSAGTDGQKKM